MQQSAARSVTGSQVDELARFFPAATPVRIPVTVQGDITEIAEDTVIEYGTPDEVLFASSLPLEVGERIRVRNGDGTLDAQVYIVGLQFQSGHIAVAGRFMEPVPNWIVKPNPVRGAR